MTEPPTSTAQLNIISLSALSLLSLLAVWLPGVRPALAEAETSRMILSQPDSAVGLAIDLAGFTIDSDQVKPDGRRYLMASHPMTGLNVSISLEQVPGQASPAGCVDHLRQLQKGPAISRGKDVALSTARDMQTLEYTLHQFQGLRLDQKSMYACMAEQNVYANIHLSKVRYTAADASLFHSLLKTVHLQSSRLHRAAAPAPTAPADMPLFPIESVRYRPNDHVRAIAP